MHLRRKCNLLFLDGTSYKYQLNLSGLLCHLKLVSLFIFILDDLSIGVSEVLKFPTIILLLSISSFMSVSSICGEEGDLLVLLFCHLEAPPTNNYAS